MVVIIHSRFSCFINIGYQFCKVIVVIISSKNIPTLPFAVYFVTSRSKEHISFFKLFIIIIFITVSLVDKVPFCFQNINAVSKILIWLCSLTTLPLIQTLHRNPYSLINIPLGSLINTPRASIK